MRIPYLTPKLCVSALLSVFIFSTCSPKLAPEGHYQETPGDSFDFDSTQQLMTADLVIDGVKRHVVMHAPKNGMFNVLDAATGKLLAGKPYVPTLNWMTGLDANGKPIMTAESNYGKTGRGFHVVPSAEWTICAMVSTPVSRELFTGKRVSVLM